MLSRTVTGAIYDFSLINEPTFTSLVNRTLPKPSLRVSFKFSMPILFFLNWKKYKELINFTNCSSLLHF